MVRRDLIPSDFIWGEYARLAARWVCRGRGAAGWGIFLGRRGSMLALRTARPGQFGLVELRRGNGGFLPFPRLSIGNVAPCHVAPHGHMIEIAPKKGRGRLIANLTTLGASAIGAASGGAAWAATAGGVSPLSTRAPSSHAPRIWRGTILKNRPVEAPSTEGQFDGRIFGAKFIWPAGSGVWAASVRTNLGANCAESGRRPLGQGYVGEHGPLDAGKCRTLCLGGRGVNAGKASIAASRLLKLPIHTKERVTHGR
jgi:hypothetical protein